MDADRSTSVLTTPRFILGLAAMFIGVIALGENLGWWWLERLYGYWPALLIVLGGVKLATGSIGWGLFGLLSGGLLLVHNLLGRDIHVGEAIVPLGLIGLGILLVSRAIGAPGVRRRDDGSTVLAIAVMSGATRTSRSQELRGGDAIAVMGGAEVDLRAARPVPEGAVVDVLAFWGVVEILVPPGWNVDCQVLPLMGGVEDRTNREGGLTAAGPEAPPLLRVRGFAVMGGVGIGHEPED